jgi:hypothetical protein
LPVTALDPLELASNYFDLKNRAERDAVVGGSGSVESRVVGVRLVRW